MRLFGRGPGRDKGPGAVGRTGAVRGRGARGEASRDGREAAAPGSHTTDAPTILLTHEGWLVGRPEGNGSSSDELLASPTIRLLARDGVRVIDRDDLLMLVPPAGGPDESRLASRRPLPVAVDLGVATLRGTCYALPGVGAWETWQRSNTGFVRVADAVLHFPDGTEETAGTVILSRAAVFRGLLPA